MVEINRKVVAAGASALFGAAAVTDELLTGDDSDPGEEPTEGSGGPAWRDTIGGHDTGADVGWSDADVADQLMSEIIDQSIQTDLDTIDAIDGTDDYSFEESAEISDW